MRFGRADEGIGIPATGLALFVSWMVALSGLYLVWWPRYYVVTAAIAMSAAGALVIGVRRYRPARWRW
jgi:hypothetical protein